MTECTVGILAPMLDRAMTLTFAHLGRGGSSQGEMPAFIRQLQPQVKGLPGGIYSTY